MKQFAVAAVAFAAGASAEEKAFPTFPAKYTAVISMELPYANIKIPMKVSSDGAAKQMISYYNGLETDYIQ